MVTLLVQCGEGGWCYCLCNFHMLSTVHIWDRSVWQTKNTKVHLKKFIYTLSLALQPFLFPNNIKNMYIFIAVLKDTFDQAKVTWILFSKCYFVANPTNWFQYNNSNCFSKWVQSSNAFQTVFLTKLHHWQLNYICTTL